MSRSLLDTFPGDPEVMALAALLTLRDARCEARFGIDGEPVPLREQDRSRYDLEAITAATALLDNAVALRQPGPCQTETAISALHCRTPTAADTKWPRIAALYECLE